MDDDVPDDDIKLDPDASGGAGYERLTVEPLCIFEENNRSGTSVTPKKRRGRPPKVRSDDATTAADFKQPATDYAKNEYDDDDGDNNVYTLETVAKQQKKLAAAAAKQKSAKLPKLAKIKREPKEPKEKQPEQCEVCGFISRSLKSHMMTHTQERNYECDFCGKKFSLRASLKNHLFAHINIR